MKEGDYLHKRIEALPVMLSIEFSLMGSAETPHVLTQCQWRLQLFSPNSPLISSCPLSSIVLLPRGELRGEKNARDPFAFEASSRRRSVLLFFR